MRERFAGGLSQYVKRGAERTRQPHAKGKPRCGECGLRVRGPNHKEGDSHKKRAGN